MRYKQAALFLSALIIGFFANAQKRFADKNKYIIDSLDFSQTSLVDKNLVDSIINLYSSAENDTTRIYLIGSLVEQCSDPNIWGRYNEYLLAVLPEKIKKNRISENDKFLYQKTLAGSLNNKGYQYGEMGDVDMQIKYYLKSLGLRKKLNDKQGLAASYNNVGYAYKTKGDIKNAIRYYKLSADVYKEINDTLGQALSCTNLGVLYENLGDFKSALSSYDKSLYFYELKNDKKGTSHAYYNLGSLYKSQEDYIMAFQYFRKALKIRQEIEFMVGIGFCYSNIGVLHQLTGNQDSAFIYFEKALSYLKDKNKIGESSCYANIANVFINKGNSGAAIAYLNKAIKIQEEIGYKQGLTSSSTNMAKALFDIKSKSESKVYAEKSLVLARELGYPMNIKESAKILYDIYKEEGNFKRSLSMYEEYIRMRDSIRNDENEKSAFKQQTKYEYEKAQAVKDAQYTKQMELVAEKEEKQTLIIVFVSVALILVLSLVFVVYNRLMVSRKQHRIIEMQKQEVEGQKKLLEQAHNQLFEKNKEVLDSINYAKRIQKAILKNEKHESKHLPEHFVLFKPKDIISGDFYWALEKSGYLYLAAADCTGHGVPGALLTMLGTSFLNEINASKTIFTPAEVLNQLRDRVIKELNQTGVIGENKDGMDISMLRIELKKGVSEPIEVMWAGANNPLYIITNNKEQYSKKVTAENHIDSGRASLIAISANKQPIGFFNDMLPFTNHTLAATPGDYFCVFTDGFADQFGGPKGKKYKYSSFKNTLLSLWEKPMEEQKKNLLNEFENWKGDLEQVDDVCVIGLKI